MLASLTAAIFLAVVLVVAPRFPRKGGDRISAALGGVGVAYVFLHVLPELAHLESEFLEARARFLPVELHAYLFALGGFMVAWEAMGRGEHDTVPSVQAVHFRVGLLSFYCLAIGSSLVKLPSLQLPLAALALGMHLLGSGRWTYEVPLVHPRWAHDLFAAAVIVGWFFGTFAHLPVEVRAVLGGLIAGGLLVNTLVNELGEVRALPPGPFLAACTGYGVLTVLTEALFLH